MLSSSLKDLLGELISKKTNTPARPVDFLSIGGGSINDTYRVSTSDGRKLFLKLNKTLPFPCLFDKEKNGLNYLASTGCIRVPQVILCETAGDTQLLVLEWIEAGIRHDGFWKKFGEQLAHLHAVTQEQFGFGEDNYMGWLPQSNRQATRWTDFFRYERLQPQIKLAQDHHYLDKQHIAAFEVLFKNLDTIFPHEAPSLLHGDLWSGNFLCSETSEPVLIDPAVYFGHRSVDLAMTTLFGGFDSHFYEAYHYHSPLPGNHREQWAIANLYPLLIHLNLFGKAYLAEINITLKRFAWN